jgi:hypothetical protein
MQILVKVDVLSQIIWFKSADGEISEAIFDRFHVCPPQGAPDLICQSELVD